MSSDDEGVAGPPADLALEYIINHVFLPPKLPQLNDTTPKVEVALTKLFHETLHTFINNLPAQDQNGWSHLPSMLDLLLGSNEDDELESPITKLDKKILEMAEGEVMALHLVQQNAGLILRKQSDTFSIETFELSASYTNTTSTIGRLVRRFPGTVIALPDERVKDDNFRQHLSSCLVSLDSESMDEALSKGVGSNRNSVHPQFVTEWLSGLLRGIGSPVQVSRIHKRTRDEVILGEDSLEPWRRSPRWLLLRVATQTSIASPDTGHKRYKIFMAYFMATVLELAIRHQRAFSSDLIYVMLAKMNRRLQKLGFIIVNLPWAEHAQEFISETMEIARSCIAKRWKTVQQTSDSAGKFRLAELKRLKPQLHTTMRLSKLRPYLENLHNVRIDQRAVIRFDGQCNPRINNQGDSLPDMLLMDRSASETSIMLMDLELWVSHSLDSWLLKNSKSTKEMDKLSRLTNWYMSKAISEYTESPGGFSVMILNLMLLWVALDKSAVHHLRNVEQYILGRKTKSLASNPSVFGDVTLPTSFGAQFYEQSQPHQLLKARIEEEARIEEDAKKRELKDSKAEFSRLMGLSNQLQCNSVLRRIGGPHHGYQKLTHVAAVCQKCKFAKQARALQIDCFEWPLPSLEATAKCVVFELDIPSLIRSWRSTTFRILADVMSVTPPPQAKTKLIMLNEYKGLASHLKKKADRLQLGSATKPQAQTFRSSQYVFEATVDSVCLSNNLNFTMQDAKSHRLALDHLDKYNIHERCTWKLPQKSCYVTLQYALNSTTHTSNEVMSAQGKCPNGLTVHEVHAFTALRSSHRLQWLNIARELISRTLNFGIEEVCLLLLQASWQAGPPALQQVSRDTHIELEEANFGQDLLSAIESGMSSIEGNWQGSIAALTFILLASRVLSVSLHDSVRARSLKFLKHARNVTVGWLRDVVKLLHSSTEEEEIAYLTLKALDLALICHTTFDVDTRQLPSLLASTDSVAILIETATIVHDRRPPTEVPLTTLTRELMRRFSRTSHTLEATLKEKIIASSTGLDKAVRRLWPGYEAGAPWTLVDAPNDRWLTTNSLDSDNAHTACCHYNVLSGEFLINGRPLARLPVEYEVHPTYKRLFGSKILGVVPSSKGLYFETRNSVEGFQIHFAMHGEQLIVRAVSGLETYEIIPLSALEDDVPHTFLHEYVHWINRGTNEAEWRPLKSKWVPSANNWRISTPENEHASYLELANRRLIDPGSATAKTVYRWLKPLESLTNINIFYNVDTKVTEIRLPRLNLDFILQNTGLESKQFRGMIVDTNQYIGTLHGLQHKLSWAPSQVLREIQGTSRSVIVPHGIVTFRRQQNHHIQVSISIGSSVKASYHRFDIDKVLGLLKDNGSLKSRLFRLYLHALTSHCLPDSLTGRTGTEEAIHGLRSPSTRSYLSLDADHMEQLKLFARLTPARDFHPKGSKFMQTVSWEKLSPLSHHEAFIEEAGLMLSQAESLQIFQPEGDLKYKMEQRGSTELRDRACIRNAFFRVDTFGAEKFITRCDELYSQARIQDITPETDVELVACCVATMVDKWSCRLDPFTDVFLQIQKWGSIISGPLPDVIFTFDKRWLDDPARFMPQYWCSIQKFLSSSDTSKDKFGIIFFLVNLAKSAWGTRPLIHTLLALATSPALRNLQPPPYDSYDLSKGLEPDKASITNILEVCKVPYEESPERQLPRSLNEQDFDLSERRRASYNSATKLQISKCLNSLVRQWPSKNVIVPQTADIQTYLPGLKDRVEHIKALFTHWYKNFEFRTYIEDIQIVLESLSPSSLEMSEKYTIPPQEDKYKPLRAYLKFDDLLKNTAPKLSLPKDDLGILFNMENQGDMVEADEGRSRLKALMAKLSRSATGIYQKDYVSDLRKSHNALLANSPPRPKLTTASPYATLKNHLVQSTANVDQLFKKICSTFITAGSPVYESAHKVSLVPRLSPSIILKLLTRFNNVVLSGPWREALVRYALAIVAMQRAERLVACGKRDSDILNELINGGHTNWDPEEYPEWLLLEVENHILIRHEQAQIALEMIDPQSGSNSIMQLNMGLGKSSVIVPIVASTLADRTKLARVIVLKSLSEQMFQLLVTKLGGLIGRRIYRLPISRSLKPDIQAAKLIQTILEECMACGGILLVQPESILSFELLGIDHVLSRELNNPLPEEGFAIVDDPHEEMQMYKAGKIMVKTQQWLYKNARDILDESDEILSVKYELIYTLGVQMNVQFSPDRRVIIQRVLSIFAEIAQEMLSEHPEGLEIVEGLRGGFPRIRILQEPVGKILLEQVAKSICRSGMVCLPTWKRRFEITLRMSRFLYGSTNGLGQTFSEEERIVVLEFITNLQITKIRAAILDAKVFKTGFIKMSLLLLRGLFAAGVLEFVFSKKRWRVNYGLDLSRSMLAVPYHAKDSPSSRSEFSHPDTAIALTCLSYYYGGLTDQQIFDGFEELLLSDQSQEEYMRWIQNSEDFPKTFKRLAGVNLRDKRQCSQDLFPWLRYSKGLIDYYLEHLVFPKEMKEFSNKLSSSGWEIARETRHPTTGFSGTNDSKYMLPTPIKQCELPEQLSTNAEVLACLLRPENSYDTEHAPNVQALDSSALLDIAVKMVPRIRVLLDVGAQLLDDNKKIASEWLEKVPVGDAQAVVFFHENDLFVLDREGMMEPLLVSPFAKQLDQTIIYLDEAHTRGTDLKMPADYRAIVTLGPDLTKDRLAQACKRLRKLGHGQSVAFCAPSEVQLKLLECSGKKDPGHLEVEDVLLWAMRNSWEFTKKGMPLWATQGIRHYRRRAVCDYAGEAPRIPISILEPEALTLDERYGLDKQLAEEGIVCRNRSQPDSDLTRTELSSIRNKCREFGLKSFGDSDLHEEQERELHPENEREQQVEAPQPAIPHKHTLSLNIRQLVQTGVFTPNDGVANAFTVFSLTRARGKLNPDDWPKTLLVTHDFCTTVQISEAFDGEGNKDSFLRPVNWLLSFKGDDGEPMYLIMSPFEVHELLPQMRGQNRVRLHVYTPRLSLSNRTLEDLTYCAVPPVEHDWSYPAISTTLNLFAGQLYLRSEDEYHRLCRFLGIRFVYPFRGVQVATDGFISPETRALQDDETADTCNFIQSPIDFLRMVTAFRRLGQTFTNSHMGKILSGEIVMSMEFDKEDGIRERVEEVDDLMDVDGPEPVDEPVDEPVAEPVAEPMTGVIKQERVSKIKRER
ncbi:hypothetical protein VTL71DRAFT_14219 [Oculimacula yallundae]|uniref:ubiquitinyl hydrolase 1 n=1 Tax=Oculimacula yallundae TaxID=86028 RepID=A0ABR4CHU8_9HELO